MNNTKQQIFGKYYLLQEIAAGGMAEIYLARPADSEANGRIFILKRILPQVTQDPEFIRMFQSEIQVSMGFNHPNLVQIFDFGKADGKHFIAMEYIEGKNLRELTLKFISMGQMIPIAASVQLIAQACAGLGYAHRYKNHVTGEALNIVHRDVSPQNILVSYDGIVKIIDFGIAKSESSSADKTRAGSIKGKLSYLSPEQLYQQELDGRSDIFSLGAVLWELLAGQKLFHQIGQSDMGILEAIAHCENVITAPSNFNDLVTAELDQIVLRALAKDRENRYSSMLEFQRALDEYLKFIQPGYDSHHLGLVIKDVFESELEEDRSRIKLLNHHAQTALQHDERTQRIQAQPALPVAPAPKPVEAPKPKAQVAQPARSKTATQIPRSPQAAQQAAQAQAQAAQAQAMLAKAASDAAAGAELAEVTGDHNIEEIPGLTMERMPPPQNFHAQHAYNYSQGSGPHYMQGEYAQQPQVIYMHEPVGGKKVKEQFYVKLTFGRALMALFYAATLLVLRLDHDQVVLNAIFGHWDGQAALADKIAPVTQPAVPVIPNTPSMDDTVSEQVAQGEAYARTHLPQVAERRARVTKGLTRVVANSAVAPAKSVLLRIRLVRKSGPAATGIMVNSSKLDLKRPTIQVQTNQLFWVQVQRKNGRPLMKSVQLKPELVGMANSYNLDVYLY